MRGTMIKLVMGIIAVGLALVFFAVPAIKLKEPAMIVVILIGVAAMIYNRIEVLREKDD
jgi:hypothetical protein